MLSTSLPKAPATPALSAALRVGSIDVLRAITMVLMIFVNDLWSLTGVPVWLEHVAPGVDGIGFSDVIFPAFLFIVGLSTPFAIAHRSSRCDSDRAILGHILSRTIALLVMGLWFVNGESINEAATGMHRLVWNTLSCISFILIWNTYPETAPQWLTTGARLLGAGTLLTLAILYRGGDGTARFESHWWGILGLIGWSYLVGAVTTLLARGRIAILALVWIAFCGLSMAFQAGLVPKALLFIPEPIIGGTLAGLTLSGVLTATVFRYCLERGLTRPMTIGFLVMSGVLIGLSVYTRTFWGLSKLAATPAWLFLCSAFTLLAFTALYWLVDVAGKKYWFRFIKPAGTDTLLCYLMPHFAYALVVGLGLHLPAFLLAGGVGLAKSFAFALLCVWVAGRLNQLGIKLKL